jgi:hypothetical protein
MRPVMIMKHILPYFMIVSLLGAGACSRHLTQTNLNQVKRDMSIKEVESILGPPTRVDSHVELPQQVAVPVTHYYYDQDGKTVELIFYGDKLASGNAGNAAITGSFGN